MSHTATGEWKSFEIRMRRRRAERLLLRAHVAADEGCFEAARASLEEARALWPAAPGLTEAQQKIDTRGTAPVSTTAPSRWKEIAAGAAALLFVVAAVTLFVVGRHDTTRQDAPLPAHDVKATVEAAVGAIPARPMAEPIPVPAPAPAPATDADSETLPPVADLFPVVSEVRRPISQPVAAVSNLRTSVSDIRPPAPDLRAPIPDLPATASSGVVPASEPATIQPPQEPLVRGVLARYAKAYSDLDADAVARVWPSVNPSALGRAFDSLESQRVSLGDCRIQIDGSSAHASCAGSSTWAPKVGGGERTDERLWTFDLEKSAGGWQILSARAQNR